MISGQIELLHHLYCLILDLHRGNGQLISPKIIYHLFSFGHVDIQKGCPLNQTLQDHGPSHHPFTAPLSFANLIMTPHTFRRVCLQNKQKRAFYSFVGNISSGSVYTDQRFQVQTMLLCSQGCKRSILQ